MLDDLYPPKCPTRGNHGPDGCSFCEDEEARFHAEERARDEAELPTDDELDAMTAALAPEVEEFRARQLAAAREVC